MKMWNSTLKSFPELKLITSPDKYFLFLCNNIYEFTAYSNGSQCAPSAKFAPSPTQASIYTTVCDQCEIPETVEHVYQSLSQIFGGATASATRTQSNWYYFSHPGNPL